MCIIFNYLEHVLSVTRQTSATQRFQRSRRRHPRSCTLIFRASLRSPGASTRVDLPIVPKRPERMLESSLRPRLNDMNPNPAPTVTKSNDEWKKQLTPEQFHVARQHGTEPPFSSPLNREKRPGLFKCVCLRALRCSRRAPSLIPAPAGPASGRRSITER